MTRLHCSLHAGWVCVGHPPHHHTQASQLRNFGLCIYGRQVNVQRCRDETHGSRQDRLVSGVMGASPPGHHLDHARHAVLQNYHSTERHDGGVYRDCTVMGVMVQRLAEPLMCKCQCRPVLPCHASSKCGRDAEANTGALMHAHTHTHTPYSARRALHCSVEAHSTGGRAVPTPSHHHLQLQAAILTLAHTTFHLARHPRSSAYPFPLAPPLLRRITPSTIASHIAIHPSTLAWTHTLTATQPDAKTSSSKDPDIFFGQGQG